AASRSGVLVQGSNYLEAVSSIRSFVFDKPGTLTKGEFKVTKVSVGEEVVTKEKFLEMASFIESYSNHPIARSILSYCSENGIKPADNEAGNSADIKEIPGRGLKAIYDGKELLSGNEKLLDDNNISHEKVELSGTVVFISYDGKYLGYIHISDSVKDGVGKMLQNLKKAGVRKTVMLTGDNDAVAKAVANEIGIDEVFSQLLPADKVAAVEKLLSKRDNKDKVAFVGDGINDAPVLMRADVGIAMGSLGSDAAIEAADVVIMDDDLSRLPGIIKIARKTVRIVKENIVFALLVKAVILVLGALGLTTMWIAVFGDVGVAVLAILNSMRALKTD
nr:HAD-IC family P-type ATPase [Butyrivibrio sp.]